MQKNIPDYAIKRLIYDIRDLKKNDLSKDGIYYEHDESNILKGYALIIGPNDTPYSYGFFLFTFEFPDDYPHNPPVVKFMTNDGIIRFHPNLYKSSKVCLSILNTWKGEQWTGCQTIRSILLTISSIMEYKALLNEPGIKETHKDVVNYDKIIIYKTIEVAIYKLLSNKIYLGKDFDCFKDIMNNYFKINIKNILNKLDDLNDTEYISTSIYNLNVKIDKKLIINNLNNLLKKLIE
jgi:ubiquitin-protein ligase